MRTERAAPFREKHDWQQERGRQKAQAVGTCILSLLSVQWGRWLCFTKGQATPGSGFPSVAGAVAPEAGSAELSPGWLPGPGTSLCRGS